jgi:hypothetical protein
MRMFIAVVVVALFISLPKPVTVSALGAGAGGSLDITTIDLSGTIAGLPVSFRENLLPIGLEVFLDTKYLLASIGYSFTRNGTITVTAGGNSSTGSLVGTLEYLDFAAFLRYPIKFQTNEFFPLLGVQYKYNVAYLDGAGTDVTPLLSPQEKADLNELWIRGGVGADFFFGSFYLRPVLTLGFKFLSPTDLGSVAAMQAAGYTSPSVVYFTVNLDVLFGWVIINERLSNVR